MRITWKRTEFDGETVPHDFEATIDGRGVGRIHRLAHGPKKGCWQWSLTLSAPGINYTSLPPLQGIAETKVAAVAKVKWAFDVLRAAKREADVARGETPAGVLDHVCSHPGCSHYGYGTPRLCFEHGRDRKRVAG